MPRKELIGKVVSDRMQKTVVVAVEISLCPSKIREADYPYQKIQSS